MMIGWYVAAYLLLCVFFYTTLLMRAYMLDTGEGCFTLPILVVVLSPLLMPFLLVCGAYYIINDIRKGSYTIERD